MRRISASSAIKTVFGVCHDLAGVSLVILISITAIDIVGRNAGLFSVRGVIEISTMAVVLIGFLALPHSFIVGGHIVVDLATLHVPERINNRIDAFWLVVAAICLAFVAWLMWGAAFKAWKEDALSLDLQAPMAIFWFPAAIGMTLAPVACLMAAFRKVRG
ncbi:MAG: TRAP transporter small permease [Betaproteobacteria bacterium]|nr:TRAP transporter small permease [Betaproteobacteria bacterium]